MIPEDLKFTRTHEWARYEDTTGAATVGISRFAVEQLGDIVFLELPEPGRAMTREAPFGVVESVKAAVDLLAPVSGEVVETNEELPENLDRIAEDPYENGWMIRIKVSDPGELTALLNAAEYGELIEGEGGPS